MREEITIEFPASTQTRQQALEVSNRTSQISSDLQDKVGDALEYLGQFVIHELIINVTEHDHLDLHGDDRNHFFSNEQHPEPDEQRYAQLIQAAQGLRSVLVLEITESEITFTIGLCRKFHQFNEKWNKAKKDLSNPHQTASEEAHGRGLLVAAKYFDSGEYDSERMLLVFRKNRKPKE